MKSHLGVTARRREGARDRAVRAMLQIDVADFEARFAKATERSLRGRNPRQALPDLRLWLHLQPAFWPALYYSGIAKRRLGDLDDALDLDLLDDEARERLRQELRRGTA